MENSPENCNVKVALHIRPLLRHERQNGGRECLDVVPGTAQVLMGSHSFIFDHVYGGGGSPSTNMFQECVIPLLDALFQGYNNTVIAYGQILKEEVRDLLESGVIEKPDTREGNPENAVPGNLPLQVRKASDGAVSLSGSTEVGVSTQKEMAACLEQGCLNRSVASTDMNNQSSRSHAIFTIILEQKDKDKGETNSSGLVMSEEYRCAKLHLVDLAGSERAKRAGSEGVRLKEGIQINKGLLALGNVISALGDDKKRKEGLHIPYRDSKLTRLLQASLGGNCKTVMIACVSPADYNAEETLNTLKYANRARNIQNKASVQKEVFPADTHKLRQQLRLLQAELSHRKEAELVEVQDLKRKVDLLEATNSELVEKIHEYRSKCAFLEVTNSDLVQNMHEYRNKCVVVDLPDANSRGSGTGTTVRTRTGMVGAAGMVADGNKNGRCGDNWNMDGDSQTVLKRWEQQFWEYWNDSRINRNRIFWQPASDRWCLDYDILVADDGDDGREAIACIITMEMLGNLDRDSVLGKSCHWTKTVDRLPSDSQEDTRGSQRTNSPKAIVESAASNILKEPDNMTIKQEDELQQNRMHKGLDKCLEQKEVPLSYAFPFFLLSVLGDGLAGSVLECIQLPVLPLNLVHRHSEMKLFGSREVEALKQQSREIIIALEEDKRLLQMERDGLQDDIARLEAALGESTAKVQTMNAQNTEADLEAKHEHEIEIMKQKSYDAKKRLQDEIHSIKSQKVQLQQKVKQDEGQYRQWKTDHEKQMQQLKKDSKKIEGDLQKLHASYQRQAQISLSISYGLVISPMKSSHHILSLQALQRKTEEAERAAKKLKELQKSQKVPTRREAIAQPRGQTRSGQIKTLKRWLDNELDKVMHVYKLRIDYEKQTMRHSQLKEDLGFLKQQDKPSYGRSRPQRGPSLSPNTRAVRIVSLESKVKSSSAALTKLSSQIQEVGRGHDRASAGRWKALHSLGDAKDLLQHLFSIAIEARRQLLEKETQQNDNRDGGSTQTTSIQNAKVSLLPKRLKEIEERAAQTARDKTPSKKSKETKLQPQAVTIGSGPPLKGKAPISLDIFADMGIESPLPFPESRQLDSNAGICNRSIQVVLKQTQKMIPMAHMSMKKLPLGEQMGKISRWRRSHDEWLIQFKWKWQKPWKLSHLIKTSDQVRNRDETLKGQHLSLRLGPST
ncbi:hypothetical protein L1987_51343 [Smallanthus sonchifolius]|uniref:Uncharacterized protein n=1 Tax=Smallanthus sonchifolius TaxID=185202 RepID=A0ACB9EPZ8_9ASTR|nr:hypothetical protein L1987_51343 [Smallanthus sonchifolius]